jgi:hypothetical protein
MNAKSILVSILIILLSISSFSQQELKHLFILSGQSNMQGLKPEESFIPKLISEFGEGSVIVVKDAMGSQPIRRWYKNWKFPDGQSSDLKPDLYDVLMNKVLLAINNQELRLLHLYGCKVSEMPERN